MVKRRGGTVKIHPFFSFLLPPSSRCTRGSDRMNELNTLSQRNPQLGAPQCTWICQGTAPHEVFVCTMSFGGHAVRAQDRTKKKSRQACAKALLLKMRDNCAPLPAPAQSFHEWATRVAQQKPSTLLVVDGDNAWKVVKKVKGFLLVVASPGFPHELSPRHEFQMLERSTSTSKDAADMLAAFRLGQLAQMLRDTAYRPHIMILSKDLAFGALPPLLQQLGFSSHFVAREVDVLEHEERAL